MPYLPMQTIVKSANFRSLHGITHIASATVSGWSEDDPLPYGHIIGALGLLVLTDLAGGFLPYFIKRRNPPWFNLINCFSGGALFALALLDILPHYAEFFNRYASSPHREYNPVYLLHFAGFMGALLLESIINVGCHCHAPKTSKEAELENHNEDNDIQVSIQPVTPRHIFSTAHEVTEAENGFPAMDTEHLHSAPTATKECASRGFGFILSASAWSIVSLGIHILFEGLMLGTLAAAPEVWTYTACVLMHKWTESFSIMVTLLRANTDHRIIMIVRIAIPLWSIVGCIIGLIVRSATSVTGVFVGAIGNGIVIYTAFETLLDSTKIGGALTARLIRAACTVGGGTLIAGLVILEHFWSPH